MNCRICIAGRCVKGDMPILVLLVRVQPLAAPTFGELRWVLFVKKPHLVAELVARRQYLI